MKPVVRNILAVIAGWVGGSIVNMAMIKAGYHFFPIPGIDPNDMEALKSIMPTLRSEHFIFPFAAHAIGTLTGALIAGLIAASHKIRYAMGIGLLFLLGGIAACFMLPAPTWFIIADLLLAYIPMAWIAGRFVEKLAKNK